MKHAILMIVAATILTACSSPGTNTTPKTSFPLKAYVEIIKASLATGTVISHLSNIPFQPINFI